MPRYDLVGRTPQSFIVVFVIGVTNFLATAIAVEFRQFWAQETADGIFSYPILFRGGHAWYFSPAVGQYIEWSFWGHFVALALLGIISYRHRQFFVRRAD